MGREKTPSRVQRLRMGLEETRRDLNAARAGFDQRNTTIASLSLAIGVGTTAASEVGIWAIFPKMVQNVFSANVVAVIFVVAIVLDLVLPKNMEIQTEA